MKKTITSILFLFVLLSASFAVDTASIEKCAENFFISGKAMKVYIGNKGFVFLRSDEITGIAIGEEKLSLMSKNNNFHDADFPISQITECSFENGIMTLKFRIE